MPCAVLGGSLCIFSCLLLASTKWHKQNKEPIREHLWDWVGEVCFYRGRSKRKYLPPGQGFIYSAGDSQITPKGSDAFGEPWRILCTGVGSLALWTEPRGWFREMFRAPSFAKGQTTRESMIPLFWRSSEVGLEEKAQQYEIITGSGQHIVMRSTDHQGPGEWVSFPSWGLGSHSGQYGWSWPSLMGGVLCVSAFCTFFSCLMHRPCFHRTLYSCYLQGEEIYSGYFKHWAVGIRNSMRVY